MGGARSCHEPVSGLLVREPRRSRSADEREELAVAGLDVARHEHRVAGDAAGLHPVLDQVDPQVQVAAHLDRTAEGDLAVALAEVQVTGGELAAVDEHRQEDPGAAGEVLDVLVAAVLPRRRGAGGLAGRLLGGWPSSEPSSALWGSGGKASGGSAAGAGRKISNLPQR
jgi:hypothetical protein